ncbi:uncharacterized protein LOC100903407 [Galendromus occidentalis]|uniref:Uncharacterized protein LOC100903407 n=1 Tax=Galendromus occidentalis TaxID=34638 RepID=A0AAJ7L540_9ACAR|nr:uncharacterized protein LOC100903407 [Galendromus occidentalis]
MKCTVPLILVFLSRVEDVRGHARLIEPPSRNTLWRFGYNAPANFEDSELFCGGIKVQWTDNQGKCGVCGDSYSEKRPRRHETGSLYDRNLTVRTYSPGEDVVLIVDVVANHLGYFEFALCPRNDSTPETDDCFTNLRVKSLNSTEIFVEEDNLRYRLKSDRKGLFYLAATLPKGVTCTKCILRWHWRSANNWGTCEDGSQATGCGPQETYRNCADVAIGSLFMGVRGGQGANVVPPKQKIPPTREYEMLLADKYHTSSESRLGPFGDLKIIHIKHE